MEPLKELALFSYYWAEKTCSSECRQYHKNWSLVRYLDLESELPQHSDYFIKQIRRYTQKKKRISILISGAADTGLLAIILKSVKRINTSVEITLLDQCQTVLMQNQIFANHQHVTIKTIQKNILNFDEKKFDLILAHSFLNFFEPPKQVKLFKKWHSLLKINGQLLINNKSVLDKIDRRKISQKIIKEKLKLIKRKIVSEELPESISNSIAKFWSNQPLRHQIAHDQLEKLILRNKFNVIDHYIIDQASKGPMANRYGSSQRTTNLLTLQRIS